MHQSLIQCITIKYMLSNSNLAVLLIKNKKSKFNLANNSPGLII